MSRKFHHSHIVCACKQVSLGEIVHAIKEKNAKTLEDLKNLTDAGASCKCCRTPSDDIGVKKMDLYLQEILDKFN